MKARLKQFDRTWCLEGTLHRPALVVLGVALAVWFWPVWVVLGWLMVRFFGLDKKVFLIAIVVGLCFFLRHATHTVKPFESASLTGTVVRIEREGTRLLIQGDGVRVWVYVESADVRAGDLVHVVGRPARLESRGLPYAFDYISYLEAVGIGGVIYDAEVERLECGTSVYRLREAVERRVKGFDEARPFLAALLMAEREGIDETGVLGHARFLGVAHVFAISGLHVTLLAGLVGKAVKRVTNRDGIAEVSAVVVALLYALVATFSPSALRAAMVVGFVVLARRFNTKHTTFDALSMAFLVSMFINPLAIRLVAFQLSFLVASSIVLVRETMKGKTAMAQAWRVSVLAFLATVPIISAFEAAVHPFTVVFNVAVVGAMSTLVLPLAFLTFAMPMIEPLFMIVTTVFETMLEALATVFSWRIRLYFSSSWTRLLYYGLFVLAHGASRHRKRYAAMLGLLVVIVHMTPYLDPRSHAIFFHVHGDAALLRDRHNRCTVLIDTGEADAQESLVQSLRGLHVTRLDYVFISHRHTDHYGAYESVANAFPIGKTITNVNQTKVEGEPFSCGNMVIYVFPMEGEYAGENDRSTVMKIWLEDEVFLFTGDIEGKREAAMLDEDLRATFLKVAHHGSITSSHPDFLTRVGARDALISTHRHNRFNHPSSVVVDRLTAHGMVVHRTDQEGTVWFRYFFGSRTKNTVP